MPLRFLPMLLCHSSAFSPHLHFSFSLALPLRSLRLCVIFLFLFCFFTFLLASASSLTTPSSARNRGKWDWSVPTSTRLLRFDPSGFDDARRVFTLAQHEARELRLRHAHRIGPVLREPVPQIRRGQRARDILG